MKNDKNPEFTKTEVFQSQGLAWMIKNEMVQDQVVQNAIVQNIGKISIFIKDLDMLTDLNRRKFLIYLRISRIGKLLRRPIPIANSIILMLQSIFPKWGVKIFLKHSMWEKEKEQLTSTKV